MSTRSSRKSRLRRIPSPRNISFRQRSLDEVQQRAGHPPFRFASQVKALLAGGRISRDPEPAGLAGFYLFGSVPEPFTLYREIRTLPAGHTQIIDAGGPHEPRPFASLTVLLAEGACAP